MISPDSDPLPLEVKLEKSEKEPELEEHKFISSPVDISVQRNVDLKDADINEETLDKFCGLLSRYSIIFSSNSEDF